MADVTGGYTGSPNDERWTRRGSGAGKFQPPATLNSAAQAQGMANEWLRGMMGSLGLGAPVQPVVTGDVGAATVEPTYGGAGRGSGAGQGRITVGATGSPGGTPAPQRFAANLGQGMQGIPTGRLGLAGGIIPGVTTALTELSEGRPTGAAGAIGGAGVGGLLGAGAARFIPSTGRFGLLGKAAQVALPFLGAQVGAQQGAAAAEYGRQSVTKIPTKGKEGEIASQLALYEKQAELGMTQFRNNLSVETSNLKDLSQHFSNLEYQNTQRYLPIVNRMKNAEAVRMQSLIASQGNQLARLNILNTAGNLAQGAQSQGGETLRTMLTSNPYANAVLRA
jgi:hypothetical protein